MTTNKPATPKMKIKRRGSAASQKPVVASDRQASFDLDHELDDLEQSVNVQVRPREPSPDSRNRSKFDVLKEQATGTLQKGIENIKRPMSSLLKRPGSRGGSRERPGTGQLTRSASKDRDLENIELPADSDGQQRDSYMGNGEKPSSAGHKVSRKTESWGDDGNSAVSTTNGQQQPKRPGSGMPRSASRPRTTQSPNRSGGGEALDGYLPKGSAAESTTMVEISDIRGGRDGGSGSPVIPHLEEMQNNEFGLTVAQAPSVAMNRMSSYKDLDGELSKHAAFQNLDGLDLSLLTKCLCPESEIRDEQVPWTWDYLFTSVCSDLRQDWEEEDEVEIEENDQIEVGN